MLADSGYLLIFWRAEAEESFKERTELSDDVLFFSPCPRPQRSVKWVGGLS